MARMKTKQDTTKPEALKEKTGSPVYSYPTKSRCPRCRSLNTTRVGEHQGIQYRQCQVPICRNRYSVQGSLA
jgi:hypothetical protein